MSDIFREIEEDLRRDNLAKLWKRYGRYLIALAIAVVLAVAAVTQWREYQYRQRRAESVRYAAALDLARQNQLKPAADALALLAREAGGGQALMARLQEAALRAKAGDDAAAIAAWKSLAADPSVDQVYRDLATLLAAMNELGTAEPESVIDAVAPLTVEGGPWRPTALEITALAHLKAGDRDKARDIYKSLADDLTAPQALRARAAEMVAALSS